MVILEPLLYYKFNTKNLENIEFQYIDCVFEKEIIKCDKPYEAFINGYATVIKINNQVRLYYRAGNIKGSDKMTNRQLQRQLGVFLRDYEVLCVAISKDGINFTKPNMGMVKYDKKIKGKNNIIRKDYFCHNFFANYDYNLKKFIGISGLKSHNNGIFVFESKDGYNWDQKNKILNDNHLLGGWRHPNHFDTLSVLLYNPILKKYYCYTRHNSDTSPSRRVQVAESTDLIKFSKCKLVKMSELGEKKDIYIPGIFLYPGTNYFLAHTCSHDNRTKNKINLLMISKDGMNFELVKEEITKSVKGSILPVYGIIEINNKFLIYVLDNEGRNINSYLCYSFKKDRIGCLYAKEMGTFRTKNIKIKSFFINFETEDDGSIDIEMYNKENELIERIENIKGDEMNKNIEFQNIKDDEIYIKFILKKAKMYSYSYNQ